MIRRSLANVAAMRAGTWLKVLSAALVGLLLLAYFALGLDEQFNIDAFRSQQTALQTYIERKPALAASMFIVAFAFATACSLPVSGMLTVIAGALFGVVGGTVIALLACTAGSTLAFLIGRFILRAAVEQRFAYIVQRINAGLMSEGPYYLFFLRLIPVLPAFLLNLAMGVTRIHTRTFAWVTLVGLLPITAVLANAGSQIVRLRAWNDMLSPGVLASLLLLGLFPLFVRQLVRVLRRESE